LWLFACAAWVGCRLRGGERPLTWRVCLLRQLTLELPRDAVGHIWVCDHCPACAARRRLVKPPPPRLVKPPPPSDKRAARCDEAHVREGVGGWQVRFPAPAVDTDSDDTGDEGEDGARGRSQGHVQGTARGNAAAAQAPESRRPRAKGAAFRGGAIEEALSTSGKVMVDVWKVPVMLEGGVSHSLELSWLD